MSKLCQCRLEKLEKKYWEHVEECSLMDCVAEGNMILIQDCVCEKKEEKYLSLKDLEKLNVGDVVRLSSALYQMSDMVSQKFELVKEKQSQSPCEHEWSVLKSKKLEYIPCMKDMYVNEYPTGMWGCHQCGLVTCNNPNDKDV